MTRMTSQELRAELNQYYGGSDQIFKASIGSLVYTSGVRFFFQHAGDNGAYWLRDILATQPEVIKAVNQVGFVLVLLTREPGSAKAKLTVSVDAQTVEGTNGAPDIRVPIDVRYERAIDHTDVQDGQWAFYIEGGVMMLPCER